MALPLIREIFRPVCFVEDDNAAMARKDIKNGTFWTDGFGSYQADYMVPGKIIPGAAFLFTIIATTMGLGGEKVSIQESVVTGILLGSFITVGKGPTMVISGLVLGSYNVFASAVNFCLPRNKEDPLIVNEIRPQLVDTSRTALTLPPPPTQLT